MRALLVSALITLVLVLAPSGASAHQVLRWHGSDYVFTSSSHLTINVCDGESDDNGFWANYQLSSGAGYWATDWNGSAPGCSGYSYSSPVVSFRMCEENWLHQMVNCSGWYGVS